MSEVKTIITETSATTVTLPIVPNTVTLQTVPNTVEKQDVNYKMFDFRAFRYKDNFRIESANLGTLLHRLVAHCINIKSGKFGHDDEYIKFMDNTVYTLLSQAYNFYCHPKENTHGWHIVSEVFKYRNFRKGKRKFVFRSWHSYYKLANRFIKNMDNADAFLVALLSAIKSRIDHFANYEYGKKYVKEILVSDNKKSNKKKKVKKNIDDRTYRGMIGLHSKAAFKELDNLQQVSCETMNTVGKAFDNFIKKLDEENSVKQTEDQVVNTETV